MEGQYNDLLKTETTYYKYDGLNVIKKFDEPHTEQALYYDAHLKVKDFIENLK